MMDVDSRGTVFAKSQVTDYCCRGGQLEDLNVIQFFTQTYESHICKSAADEDGDSITDI